MLEKSIFIFHRSLRITDNIGLINCSKLSKKVIPVFIFTPEQIDKNDFKSYNAIKFMIQCLEDLNKYIKKYNKNSKLHIYFGKQEDIIEKMIKKDKEIEGVFSNTDYTKYAMDREKNINDICLKYDVYFQSFQDYLLHDIDSVLTGSGTYYSKFTPFYLKIIDLIVDKPDKFSIRNLIGNYKNITEITLTKIKEKYLKKSETLEDQFMNTIGSRENGIKRLKNIKDFKKYNTTRDDMTIDTTNLSSHIKFGTISIREVYYVILNKLGKNHSLIRQLYWREFYFNIAFHNPKIFNGKPFKDNPIKWKISSIKLEKWKHGLTGYPIVDASMRELNQTGYMHNRGRLITSNFLVKLLNIDWREGEKYFSQKLIDYDPSINNGNWQWTAGSGADSQQYTRIYNPISQGQRHDSNAEYIKKWIPELSSLDTKIIHNWPNCYSFFKHINYVKPIADYKKMREESIKLYKKSK